MLILKLHVPAVNGHQLLRRHDLPHIDIELHLLPRQRIDERIDQLEEAPHDPGHVLDARVAEPLRVVVLQDGERLPALRHGGVLALAALLEVDQDGQGFLAGRDEVDAALEHEDEVLHLLLAALCVLPVRVQVEAGPALVVVAPDDLLARLVLAGYVVGRVLLDLELAPPDQGALQARRRVGFVPLGRAQVAEQAFARQPEAFAVREGLLAGRRSARGCG